LGLCLRQNFQKNSRRLRPRLRFRQFQKNIYLQAMLQANYMQIFALRLCLGLCLRQNFRKFQNLSRFSKK
ncbi:hypothetical protein T01_3419, partial [Trichinella spiralis]